MHYYIIHRPVITNVNQYKVRQCNLGEVNKALLIDFEINVCVQINYISLDKEVLPLQSLANIRADPLIDLRILKAQYVCLIIFKSNSSKSNLCPCIYCTYPIRKVESPRCRWEESGSRPRSRRPLHRCRRGGARTTRCRRAPSRCRRRADMRAAHRCHRGKRPPARPHALSRTRWLP